MNAPVVNNGQDQQYNPHPFIHMGGIGAGSLLGIHYGIRKAHQYKSGIPNYGDAKKKYSNIRKDISNYNLDKGNPGEHLSNYMKENNLSTVKDAEKFMRNKDEAYRGLLRVRGARALGTLGLGVAAYNGYKMVANDMNRHPVLENM